MKDSLKINSDLSVTFTKQGKTLEVKSKKKKNSTIFY